MAQTVGDYARAEPYLEQALSIRKKELSDEHPDVAASLNNLAGLYQAQGRYAEAEPFYQQSLAIKKKRLGAAHPDVAQSIYSLAKLYFMQSRYDEAEALAQNSLKIFKGSQEKSDFHKETEGLVVALFDELAQARR